MVGDPDIIKEILVKEFPKFHDRRVCKFLSNYNLPDKGLIGVLAYQCTPKYHINASTPSFKNLKWFRTF